MALKCKTCIYRKKDMELESEESLVSCMNQSKKAVVAATAYK